MSAHAKSEVISIERQSQKDGWEELVRQSGVIVYSKKIQKGWGAAIPIIKGCFSLPGVHPDTTLRVLTDIQDRSRWDANFERTSVLEQLEGDAQIAYFALRSQLGISPRDIVEKMTIFKNCPDAAGGHVIIFEGAEHQNAPEREGYLRAATFLAGYVIREHPQSNGSSHVMAVNHSDPRGNIPSNLIMTLAAKEPVRFYQKLLTECKAQAVKSMSPFKRNHHPVRPGPNTTKGKSQDKNLLPSPAGIVPPLVLAQAGNGAVETVDVAGGDDSSHSTTTTPTGSRYSSQSNTPRDFSHPHPTPREARILSRRARISKGGKASSGKHDREAAAALEAEATTLSLRKCPGCDSWYTGPMGDHAPKVLNCLHTMCVECLSAQEESGVVPCPCCGVETAIPTRGARQLKDSYPAISLMTTAATKTMNEATLVTDAPQGGLEAAEARHAWEKRVSAASLRVSDELSSAEANFEGKAAAIKKAELKAAKFFKEMELVIETQKRRVMDELGSLHKEVEVGRKEVLEPLEAQLGGVRRAKAFAGRCSDIELGQFELQFEGLLKQASPSKLLFSWQEPKFEGDLSVIPSLSQAGKLVRGESVTADIVDPKHGSSTAVHGRNIDSNIRMRSEVIPKVFDRPGEIDKNRDAICAIAMGSQGEVYTCLSTRSGALRMSEDGRVEATIGTGERGYGDGDMMGPGGVAVDVEGMIYVTDTGNHRVQVFNADATFSHKFGSVGSAIHLLKRPGHITAGAGKTIAIADSDNRRISVWSNDGGFRCVCGGKGSGEGQFEEHTSGVALTADGAILATDSKNGTIQVWRVGESVAKIKVTNDGRKLTPSKKKTGTGWEGTYIRSIGMEAGLVSPSGLHVIPATENILVCDTGNRRVVELELSGVLLRSLCDGELVSPWGVVMRTNGVILVCESKVALIRSIEPSEDLKEETEKIPVAQSIVLQETQAIIVDAAVEYVNADSFEAGLEHGLEIVTGGLEGEEEEDADYIAELDLSREEGALLAIEQELLLSEMAGLGDLETISPLGEDSKWLGLDEKGLEEITADGGLRVTTTCTMGVRDRADSRNSEGPSPVSSAIKKAKMKMNLEEAQEEVTSPSWPEASPIISHRSMVSEGAGTARSSKDGSMFEGGFSELPSEEALDAYMVDDERAEIEYYMGEMAELRFDTLVGCLLELQRASEHEIHVEKIVSEVHLLIEGRRRASIQVLRDENDERKRELLPESMKDE